MSRVNNVYQWGKKLVRLSPVTSIAVETCRFDTQKLQNPEISGIEYQQGELLGYEVREYLLEKWGRKCAYCDKEGVPLQIEHITPKIKGGTNSISNLTLACKKCNEKKGSKDIGEFLAKDTKRLEKILACTKATLKDAAAVNVTRYAIGNALKSFGLPISFHSGGRTKYNRTKQGYAKDHWIDAACVGETGERVQIAKLKPLKIHATGRGARQVCRVDQYGFPRTKAKKKKRVFGFETGDMVKAIVTSGKKKGTYVGKVAIRASGSFNIQTHSKTVQGISYKDCTILHRTDGYTYPC
jgi:5-methylcytosine-specific restriction endonuclease McrA